MTIENIFLLSTFIASFPILLSRLHVTLFIVLAAFILGLIVALAIAGCRLKKIIVLSQLATFYVSLIRGIPILVLLFIIYVGLPIVFGKFNININRFDPLFFVIIAYTLNIGAFLSEVIRSAISAVDPGQKEAAYSVGMTSLQAFRRIILPQAFKVSVPALGNIIIGLLKNSSLAYVLGVIDVMGIIQIVGTRTNRTLEAYAAAAIIFFVLSYVLEHLFKLIEKRVGMLNRLPAKNTH